jgi:hypothetical protein
MAIDNTDNRKSAKMNFFKGKQYGASSIGAGSIYFSMTGEAMRLIAQLPKEL